MTLDFRSQEKVLRLNLSEFNNDSLYHSSAISSSAINDFFSSTTKRNNQKCDLENLIHPLLVYRSANLVLQSSKLPVMLSTEEDVTDVD